jgi:hypothetical protein
MQTQSRWSDGFSNWVTADKAAKILGKTTSTVSRYASTGKLPLRVRNTSTYFYLPAIVTLQDDRGGQSELKTSGKSLLRRSESGLFRGFRARVEAVYQDVIYETSSTSNEISITAFSKQGQAWSPVMVEKVSRQKASA